MTITEQIAIDRDPLLALQEARDALEFSLMHPAALARVYPQSQIKRLEMALMHIKNATRESDVR